MLTYKIHLFRHGITRANLEGKYVGLTDYPLCQEGIDALKEFADGKDYPPIEKIYTSPLRRCRETAKILYPGYKTFDVPQLMEMDFGTYEGKTLDELQNDETFIAWSRDSMHNAPPEGEDGLAFIRRVIKGLDDVFQDMMANDVHSAALVIPGGMIMSMLALMGFPRHPMGEWECAAGAGYTIVMTPELWSRDKVFEVLACVPMTQEDWDDHWSTKKYYEDGEEMFFE